MRKTISLHTYWTEWMEFSLTKFQLLKLRGFVLANTDKTISMEGYRFKMISGFLYFSNSGVPSELYFEMPLNDVVVEIDRALSEF